MPTANTPDDPSVKKHVAAIHCSGELSLVERKLSNVLLLHAYDRLLSDRSHQIPVTALSVLLGFDSNDTGLLRRALLSLVSTPLEYDILNDNPAKGKGWGATALLSRGEIHNGICSYAYDESLANKLYDPEIFARINLAVQSKFESSFTLNLHENCVRFRSVGSTGWWDLDKFRRLMGATAKIYDSFPMLNQRVIKPAVSENNKFAEILLDVEYERGQGRGAPVKRLKFIIKDHPQRALFKSKLDNMDSVRATPGYQALIHLGCAERVALMYAYEDPARALQVAEYTKNKFKAGKIKKPGAYVAHLINTRADIGLAPIERDALVAPQAQSNQPRAAPPAPVDRAQLRVEYQRDRHARAAQMLTPDLKKQLVESFIEADKAKGGSAHLAYNPSKDRFRGFAQGSFDVYVADQLLGEYTEEDIDNWRARRK